MTPATRSLLTNARGAATDLRVLSRAIIDDLPMFASELFRRAADLERDAAAVEAERAVVVGTDDDAESELELGPLDRKW